YKTCSATGCQLSVEPNGAAFACKGSSGYFGNVLDMPALLSSENWKKYSLRAFRNAPACENCEIENFCSGFCLGPLEKKYHDINVVEKDTCELYKKLVKGLIYDVRKYEVDTLCML
ncbi:MAG: SPASM domain-containing protein, partial [Geobacteraceae bacterium]|nr:SPASM domain-containing protein [Geobacteraceae bacterium]